MEGTRNKEPQKCGFLSVQVQVGAPTPWRQSLQAADLGFLPAGRTQGSGFHNNRVRQAVGAAAEA